MKSKTPNTKALTNEYARPKIIFNHFINSATFRVRHFWSLPQQVLVHSQFHQPRRLPLS